MPPEKPDVIMVMSESFWDPTLLPNTKLTPDPIPTVRKTRSGSMFSPEFGGMTANVEFEALTGFSNAFLNQFQSSYDSSQYDPRGRFVYLTGNFTF